MITNQHKKEGFSRAFALAVGYKAGMNCSVSFEFDYRIDGTYREVDTLPDGSRDDSGFQIDFQLKASHDVLLTDDYVIYDLEAKNYKSLIRANVGTPRILILFKMPKEECDWLKIDENETLLRNSGWYFSLKNLEEKVNSSTVRIKIPRNQLFTPDVLNSLMDRVKAGEQL